MEYARKMALVDPQLLASLRPPTDTTDKVLRGVDNEMRVVLDRTNLDEGDKVKLYNQILLRYNSMADIRLKQPTRVVVIKDDGSVKDNETAAAAAAAATAVNVAASGLEFDIADSVPKSMKTKVLRLVDRLRNDPAIQWNDRGELIHEGVALAGSNIEDLVHDILRKRKTSVDPSTNRSY